MKITLSNECKDFFQQSDIDACIAALKQEKPNSKCLLPIEVGFSKNMLIGGETTMMKDILGNISIKINLSQLFMFDTVFMLQILYHELYHAVEMSSLECVVMTSDSGIRIFDNGQIVEIHNIKKYRNDKKYHDSFDFEKRAIAFSEKHVQAPLTLTRQCKHAWAIFKGAFNAAKNQSINFSLSTPMGFVNVEEIDKAKAILSVAYTEE